MKSRRLFNARLFVIMFATLILGIAFSASTIAGIVFFFLLAIVSTIVFARRHEKALIAVVLIAYVIGFVYSTLIIYTNNNEEKFVGEEYVEGVVSVTSEHDVNTGKVHDILVLTDVRHKGKKVGAKVRIYLNETEIDNDIFVGDKISFYGSLTRKPLEIDSLGASRLYTHGIRYDSTFATVQVIDHDALDLRESIIYASQKFMFSHLDRDTAGFLMGMMFGDTSSLTEGIRVTSRRLGTAHLFAVSGLHVSILVGFIIAILDKLKVRRGYHLLVVIPLAFYVYICGFSVSVMRASIMIIVYLIAKTIHMRYDIVSSISFAGTLLLLVCPMYLFDISFVLSFLAVISIALFAGPIARVFMKKSGRFKVMKNALAANIAVNIGLLPIMLHVFGGMSLITIPANLIIIPIVSLIFPIFFFLYIIVSVIGVGVLLEIIAFPFSLIIMLSKWLTGVSALGINFSVSHYFVITYVIVMLVVSRYVFIDKRLKLTPKICLVLLVVASGLSQPIIEGIYGSYVVGCSSDLSYSVIYRDNNGDNVMAVMGKIDAYAMDNAVKLLNRKNEGTIDKLVVPNMSEEDRQLVAYYNDTLGARFIVTADDVYDGDGMVLGEVSDIEMTNKKDVVINVNNVDILLLSPANSKIPPTDSDVIVALNKWMRDEDFTPKYYINFAKVSRKGLASDFTFYAKNGKITLHNIKYNEVK